MESQVSSLETGRMETKNPHPQPQPPPPPPLQSHPQLHSPLSHSNSRSIQDHIKSTSSVSSSSSSSASPLTVPDLLPSSSSDRSSFSTLNSSSSRPTSNLISSTIQSAADQPFSRNSLSSPNPNTVEYLTKMAAEQEKQAHYVSRRSPLGPRPEGFSPSQESEEEEERIERAQAQAERDMYMHIHAHMQKPTSSSVDRRKSNSLTREEERRKLEETTDREGGRFQSRKEPTTTRSGQEENGIGNVAVRESAQDNRLLSQETSQRGSQQDAQLQAAAQYASLASSLSSSSSVLKDSFTRQEMGEVNHLPPSQPSQDEIPRLSTSSAESSVNSEVATPERYERQMWGRPEASLQEQRIDVKAEQPLERQIEERYPDPQPDTQDLNQLQAMLNQSSISSQSTAAEKGSFQESNPSTESNSTRPPMPSRMRSSDKSNSASSSHTTIPSRSSSIKSSTLNPDFQPQTANVLTSTPSPSSTVSTLNSAVQTPAAVSQDRDPTADALASAMNQGNIRNDNGQVTSSPSQDQLTKPMGMSASSSSHRKAPPSAPGAQEGNPFPSSSSSSSSPPSSMIPHSSPTASTASGLGIAPTSPTTAGLSLRASLASPDSWRSLLPEHDPYFADPDAEEGSRSTAGSVSGGSASNHGHGIIEDRFRKNSRQNSQSSALGIASMNTPSATSLSAQLAQFGVGSEPFPRCSSRGSAAGSSSGAVAIPSNPNGTAYAYASSQGHTRKLSNTSQLSSFSLPGPIPSGSNPSAQDENWEEMERERIKRESWRSFLPESDPAHPTSNSARRDLSAPNPHQHQYPHRRTNTNSATSMTSSPSLSFSDSPPIPNQQYQRQPQQNISPSNWYPDHVNSPHQSTVASGQVGNTSSSNSPSVRHASFSAWESAQRDRDGFRGTIRKPGAIGGGQDGKVARNGSDAPSRRTGSHTSFSGFDSGMVHSHSQPPYVYPTSSTSTSHSTTQITSYRNLHQQLQGSNLDQSQFSGNGNRRIPTSAVIMADAEERENWPSSRTSLSSFSLSNELRERDRSLEDGEERRASGLRGDLEGWTTAREVDFGNRGLTRSYDSPVSIVQERLDPNSPVLLTTTTTTTTTTFTTVSQPQSPKSERSNPSPSISSMQGRSYSSNSSGLNTNPSSPIAVPQSSGPNQSSGVVRSESGGGSGGIERSESPYLVSPLSPPSVPFLDHRQAPASTQNLSIETTSSKYILNLKLPNFNIEHITLATKHHRTLHIVADNWTEDGGGHVERRITFHNDALMRQVQAEFDGELLKVIVPRRALPAKDHGNSFSPLIQPGSYSNPHLQQQQQQQQNMMLSQSPQPQ